MKEALVLLNMGGPRNLDEVEVFLTNMFNDRHIISVKSDLLRSFIAFMITTSRKKEAKSNYAKLGGKSPIIHHTQSLISALQKEVSESIYVTHAMRYTPPFATEVFEALKAKGVERIYLFPLYPQYSDTTTASSLEDFYEAAQMARFDPSDIIDIKSYYRDDQYNQGIVEQIKATLGEGDPSEFEMIFSAHGLPQKVIDNGDVYQKHIEENVAILKQMLHDQGIHFKVTHLAYQSKVGPMKWLEPGLEDMLRSMGGKKVIIYPIAFTIDNSETDFELSIEYKEVADEVGISDYRVAPCLNDHPFFVQSIVAILQKMRSLSI
jgi:ferrochelatase